MSRTVVARNVPHVRGVCAAHGNHYLRDHAFMCCPRSRLEQRLVEGTECLRLDLSHLAVVREQAVHLALDIGGLCVDAWLGLGLGPGLGIG